MFSILGTFTVVKLKIVCERQRALHGIKCVRRIFLTNMAAHTDEKKKIDAL